MSPGFCACVNSTAPFEQMQQHWRAVDNLVSNLTGPRFEPQTFCSVVELVAARSIGQSRNIDNYFNLKLKKHLFLIIQ